MLEIWNWISREFWWIFDADVCLYVINLWCWLHLINFQIGKCQMKMVVEKGIFSRTLELVSYGNDKSCCDCWCVLKYITSFFYHKQQLITPKNRQILLQPRDPRQDNGQLSKSEWRISMWTQLTDCKIPICLNDFLD